MNCDRAEGLLSAWVDSELADAERAELNEHLASCANCGARIAEIRALSESMHNPELRFTPPRHLESRVLAAVRSAGPKRAITMHPAWFAAAACLVAAIGMAWIAFVREPHRAETQTIAAEVVSSHIRSLQAGHLYDVPSEDRHTVKPWFDGRLSFSPDVKDLAAQGFKLAGGRLDSIDGKTVAALVFQRRLHVINLYVWPATRASTDSPPGAAPAENGYNIVRWTHAGTNYWAIADIPVDELREFARLYLE